ncbi:MAG: hypothetical protein AVDCRST_MAG49-3160 [uncultured Thermomicrobiales bacterium]|uniref:Uncharacterized protein n=1 Tax=uncultured Thermomicrobiales bacterium TaxID=1645740 RepID=A0A6J4V5Q7_9BACT|nr:MAG: hypothetical protein AVDCRST_MAG49-3160 [uncultured Thermomicrobiales bacterium]
MFPAGDADGRPGGCRRPCFSNGRCGLPARLRRLTRGEPMTDRTLYLSLAAGVAVLLVILIWLLFL